MRQETELSAAPGSPSYPGQVCHPQGCPQCLPTMNTHRLEDLKLLLAARMCSLLNSALDALVLTGLLLHRPYACEVGAVGISGPELSLWLICGFRVSLVLHLQDGTVGADIIFPIPFQKPPSRLGNASLQGTLILRFLWWQNPKVTPRTLDPVLCDQGVISHPQLGSAVGQMCGDCADVNKAQNRLILHQKGLNQVETLSRGAGLS